MDRFAKNAKTVLHQQLSVRLISQKIFSSSPVPPAFPIFPVYPVSPVSLVLLRHLLPLPLQRDMAEV